MTDDMNKRRDELADQISTEQVSEWTCGCAISFKKGFDACYIEMQAQVDELKEANSNCISLSLHESRMKNVEQELNALKTEIERHKDLLRKQCNHSQDLQEALDIVTDSSRRKRGGSGDL